MKSGGAPRSPLVVSPTVEWGGGDEARRRASSEIGMTTIGHAALPYGVSVGRLHAVDVLPRIILNAHEAESEEGLKFAEAFGLGASLHFKLGKLLLSLSLAAAVLQAPALAFYARRGKLPRKRSRNLLLRYSMAAVGKSRRAGRLVECSVIAATASLATLTLLCGAAAARELVRKDVAAMKALAPRPEHYTVLLRDVSPDATAAGILADLRPLLGEARIVRVAVHHALRPVLDKAVETMAAEADFLLWERRAARYGVLRRVAIMKKRRLDRVAAELGELARSERPARAVAAFVVFDSPRVARDAAVALAKRLRRISAHEPRGPLGAARPSMAPSPAEIIWENLEVSIASRAARRLFVRLGTLLVCCAALVAVFLLRGRAIEEEENQSKDDDDDFWTNTTLWQLPRAKAEQALGSATSAALRPYLTRDPSPRRHALILVGVVVVINSILRFIVRRGSLFEAHATRSTEQSAALVSYFASTTSNTLACYALAALRGATRLDSQWLWYTDVSLYLTTTLFWEALAPPAGALLRVAARRLLGIPFDRDLAARQHRATDDDDDDDGDYKSRRRENERRRPPRRTTTTSPSTEMTPLFHRGGATSSEGYEPRAYEVVVPATPRRQRRSVWRFLKDVVTRYLAATPWDATARAADMLRVFFIGAVYGAGQPVLPWLALACLAAMLAHDKWALLRERALPPRLGAHLARTAAKIAPVAAPAHAILALWTWSDPAYTAASPLLSFLGVDCDDDKTYADQESVRYFVVVARRARRVVCAVNAATWPLGVALLFAVASIVAINSPTPARARRRRHDGTPNSSLLTPPPPPPVTDTPPFRTSEYGEDDDDDDDDAAAAVVDEPPRRALDHDFPTWRDAVRDFERRGIPHLYDVYDDARPLEPERHPDFFHHWRHLSSGLAKNVLEVFTPPRGRSDSATTDAGDPSSVMRFVDSDSHKEWV